MFDTPVGKVGLLICWDLAFPEAFRELISQGAQIICIPTFCECIPQLLYSIVIADVSPRDPQRLHTRGSRS